MIKLQLFEFVILWHPTEEEYKKGEVSKIVVDRQLILDVDHRLAEMSAAFLIPEQYRAKKEQLQIIVRPF